MTWIIFALVVMLVVGVLIFVLSALKVGADADSDNYRQKRKEEKEDMFIVNCEYCHKIFNITEKDALVKYKYGTRYIVHCPYCDKLTKVNID